MEHDAPNLVQRLLAQYWPHLAGSGIAVGLTAFFWKAIGDLATGTFQKLGEGIGNLAGWMLNRRKKTIRRRDDVTIGALTQEVKDQGKTIRKLEKRVQRTENNLVNCQAERTECRADLRNLVIRITAVEKKTNRKTA